MDVDVPYDPPFVDNEDRPFRDPFRPQDVILDGNVTVGPEIAEHRERNIDALGPRLEAGDIVGQHTQDLGVALREEVFELLVRGKLASSDGSERRRQECQQHVLLSPEIP
jgi:hypothetical protein